MNEIIETIKYKGYNINIYPDDCDESPRECDNLGTMICFHKRYNLGDKHELNQNDFNSWDELEDGIIEHYGKSIILPIYMYDHSGITISTSPFGCPWDSGQIGYIFITKEKVKKEYGWKVINKERKNKIIKYLDDEIKTYDQYLRGDIVGYKITNEEDEEDNEIDSCWGFYNKDDMIKECESIIDHYLKENKNIGVNI
jgi:hypothetical protein